jgi:hypothetical protein
VPLTDSGRKTAKIVVGSIPRCTPASVRTCDLCVRKTADIDIRDVADDTSIYQPSAHLEAASTGLVGMDRQRLRGLRPFPCPPSWKCCAAPAVSSASCAMRAASNGVSPRSVGRGSPPACRHGAGRAPSGKGSCCTRVRLRRLAAGWHRPGRGAMQITQKRLAACRHFYAASRWLEFLTFAARFLAVSSDGPWRGSVGMAEEEERQGPCPTKTTARSAVSPSIPAFGELPKPSVDSWLALRASLRAAANDNKPRRR